MAAAFFFSQILVLVVLGCGCLPIDTLMRIMEMKSLGVQDEEGLFPLYSKTLFPTMIVGRVLLVVAKTKPCSQKQYAISTVSSQLTTHNGCQPLVMTLQVAAIVFGRFVLKNDVRT